MEKIALLSLFATLLTAEVLAYKQEDLDRLRDTHNCVKCDLHGAILKNLLVSRNVHVKACFNLMLLAYGGPGGF